MSDPTARRADVLSRLLSAMKNTQGEDGWSLLEVKTYLWKQYRRGVRNETIDHIVQQLAEYGSIVRTRRKTESGIYQDRWFATEEPGPPESPRLEPTFQEKEEEEIQD